MIQYFSRDIHHKIARYLPFEDKYRFGKVLNVSFFRYYDFNNQDYIKNGTLDSLFYYCKYKSGDSDSYSDENNHDLYCEYRHYAFNMVTEYLKKKKNIIDSLQYDEFNCVYIRSLIEYIEDNNIKIKYNNKENIYNITKYNNLSYIICKRTVDKYKKCFYNDFDNMRKICVRCGCFGHINDGSKSCLFYDEYHTKKIIIYKILKLLKEHLTEIKNIQIKKMKKERSRSLKCAKFKI